MEASQTFDFAGYIAKKQDRINYLLSEYTRVNRTSTPMERAIRHSLDIGLKGKQYAKRLRPILTLALSEAYHPNGEFPSIEYLAMVPEILHSASLILDDKQDKSEKRRNRAATHIAYGIDTADNATVSMINMAVELIGKYAPSEYAGELTSMAGAVGRRMTVGQEADNNQTAKTPDKILDMYRGKSGALLGLSACLGVVGIWPRESAQNFGDSAGVAFQIIDDLNDKRKSSESGKDAGRDEDLGKLTYVRLVGREKAIQRAIDEKENALAHIRGKVMLENLVNTFLPIPSE